MDSIEEDFEYLVINFFLENRGKAFTIGALRKRFEGFTIDSQIKEYSRYNLQTIIKKLSDSGKIKIIQHDMKTHYFLPEIFKSTQTEGKIQYFNPEVFISAEQATKKAKKRFCKNCKKEVVALHRYQKGQDSVWFPILASFTSKSIEARVNSGWFCPNCGERLNVYKRAQIIGYLSCVILTGFLITSIYFTGGEVQWSMFTLAIFFSVATIFLTVRQLIKSILKRSGRKILEKMKDLPRESLRVK